MENLSDARHSQRQQWKVTIYEWLDKLESDESLRLRIETWKETLFGDETVAFLQRYISNWQAQVEKSESVAVRVAWLERQFEQFATRFREDEPTRRRWNRNLQLGLSRLLRANHSLVGQIALDKLNEMNDAELISFIEQRTGDDLQMIRINGAFVGAVVGCVLYVFAHFMMTGGGI